MGFAIEQECPQCGAPLTITETDRLLECPYCDVKNFLYTPSYFRYVLPNKAPDRTIIYVPYLRFRGSVFFCSETKIGHKILDITQAGSNLKGIPASLGLRPQAMTARFATGETPGRYLKFSLKAVDILTKASKLSSGSNAQEILHRAFIGETMSIMYLPIYLKDNQLFDAVLNRAVAEYREGFEGLENLMINKFPETLSFLPTLCPQCGWNLNGDRDSVVLTCNNCSTAWEARGKKYSQVKIIMAGEGENDNSVYIPFWKITAETNGVNIESFADYIKITNQPVMLSDRHETMPMNFWSPAFKIRPKMFLNLARQLTLMQGEFDESESIPEKGYYPITLPLSEAVQSLKMILASSAITKKNIMPYIPEINFEIKDITLIYLPFRETQYDMIQDDLGLSINRQSLEFGRKL
ncbi:hypothetical protein ACFL6W_02690 [Thermodesulfobacteriota bacterium]